MGAGDVLHGVWPGKGETEEPREAWSVGQCRGHGMKEPVLVDGTWRNRIHLRLSCMRCPKSWDTDSSMNAAVSPHSIRRPTFVGHRTGRPFAELAWPTTSLRDHRSLNSRSV